MGPYIQIEVPNGLRNGNRAGQIHLYQKKAPLLIFSLLLSKLNGPVSALCNQLHHSDEIKSLLLVLTPCCTCSGTGFFDVTAKRLEICLSRILCIICLISIHSGFFWSKKKVKPYPLVVILFPTRDDEIFEMPHRVLFLCLI